MRNIFLFIRRYFVFLTFVGLQVIALWMVFSFNRFHKAAFMGVASEITGSVNSQVDKVDDYFNLRDENRRVHRMNDSLLNLLRSNFNIPDSNVQERTDSMRIDSITQYRRYLYRDAKVVFNSVNRDNNYLQLNRGERHGIRPDMAVVSSDGSIVGIVINTSRNFSQVMSLLHTKAVVTVSHKKSGVGGRVKWDGVDPRLLLLEGISRDVEVKRGDTILTSGYSYNFPPNFMIGRVAQVKVNKATNFLEILIQPGVNFSSVQQVFVVENLQRDEQMQLEKETEKKMEQKRNNR